MPGAGRRIRLFTLLRIVTTSTICVLLILLAIVVGWRLFATGKPKAGSPGAALTGRRMIMRALPETTGTQTEQRGKPAATVPLLPDNEPDAPLVITEASAEVGEPYETILKGMRGDNQEVTLIDKGEKARRMKFAIKMVNKSDHDIRQFVARILNPAFFADETTLVSSSIHFMRDRQIITIKPQKTYTFTVDLPVSDRKNGQELMSHLSDFRVKIAEVGFEPGTAKEWIEGGKFSNLFGRLEDNVLVTDCPEGKTFNVVKKRPISEQPAPTSGQRLTARLVLMSAPACPPRESYWQSSGVPPPSRGVPPPMSVVSAGSHRVIGDPTGVGPVQGGLQPTILYKEKARYTEEARANKVQGTVILDVLFNADGTITDIKVVQGLPDGLNEKAIEAARKVRFQPATKDGVPVSVRGPLSFNFNLY